MNVNIFLTGVLSVAIWRQVQPRESHPDASPAEISGITWQVTRFFRTATNRGKRAAPPL